MKIYGREYSNDYWSNDLDLHPSLLCNRASRSKGALKKLAAKARRRIARKIVLTALEEEMTYGEFHF